MASWWFAARWALDLTRHADPGTSARLCGLYSGGPRQIEEAASALFWRAFWSASVVALGMYYSDQQ